MLWKLMFSYFNFLFYFIFCTNKESCSQQLVFGDNTIYKLEVNPFHEYSNWEVGHELQREPKIVWVFVNIIIKQTLHTPWKKYSLFKKDLQPCVAEVIPQVRDHNLSQIIWGGWSNWSFVWELVVLQTKVPMFGKFLVHAWS